MTMLTSIYRNSQVLCKAAANVSGDIPSSSSSTGMSQYEKIIETLTTLFPLWVCCAFSFLISKSSMHIFITILRHWAHVLHFYYIFTGHIGHCYWHLQAICSKLVTLSIFLFLLYKLLRSPSLLIRFWNFWQVTWLQTDLFTVGLGFLMLSMGLTLTFEDFRRCLRNPWTVRSYPFISEL